MADQEQRNHLRKASCAKAAIRIKLLSAHPNDALHIEMQYRILSCRVESTLRYCNFILHAVNLESFDIKTSSEHLTNELNNVISQLHYGHQH